MSSAPKWVVIKRRDGTPSWQVFHTSLGGGVGIELDNAGASGSSSSIWNSTAPTSSVVHIGTHGGTNTSSGTYVAYCFAEVEGFSRFGSYIGNGNADGPFVFTGFRPAFLIIKRTDVANNWVIMNNKSSPFNAVDDYFYANVANAEYTSTERLDMLSNGFKLTKGGSGYLDQNASSGTYIYMAFGSSFKYATAR